MLQTEHLLATVAGEGEEIELVAIGVLAVAAEIGESLCSSGGGHGDLFVGPLLFTVKLTNRNRQPKRANQYGSPGLLEEDDSDAG